MYCTCKLEKYKQYFLSENYEQTFPNKKHTQFNLTHMNSINNRCLVKTIIEYVMRTCVLRRPIVFLRFRCSILILLIKTVRCSIRSLYHTLLYI
jgi:hypothetical protein